MADLTINIEVKNLPTEPSYDPDEAAARAVANSPSARPNWASALALPSFWPPSLDAVLAVDPVAHHRAAGGRSGRIPPPPWLLAPVTMGCPGPAPPPGRWPPPRGGRNARRRPGRGCLDRQPTHTDFLAMVACGRRHHHHRRRAAGPGQPPGPGQIGPRADRARAGSPPGAGLLTWSPVMDWSRNQPFFVNNARP